MTNTSALVLIDLQNEFLSPEGNFPIPDTELLISNVTSLVSHFRAKGSTIFWVRACYAPYKPKASKGPRIPFDPLNGKHTGKTPCCIEGTPGADFPPAILALIKSNEDIVFAKTWYSSFKETDLEAALRKRGVTDVYIAGLMTNVCVLSTAAEAKRLGFEVRVVEECLGYARKESHDKALRALKDLGVGVIVASLAGSEAIPTENAPLRPTLYYVNGSIPSWRVMMALYEKVCRR